MLGTGGCWAQGIELYDFEQYDVTHTLKYFDEGCTAQTQGTELQTMLNVLEMNLNEHVLSVEEQR